MLAWHCNPNWLFISFFFFFTPKLFIPCCWEEFRMKGKRQFAFVRMTSWTLLKCIERIVMIWWRLNGKERCRVLLFLYDTIDEMVVSFFHPNCALLLDNLASLQEVVTSSQVVTHSVTITVTRIYESHELRLALNYVCMWIKHTYNIHPNQIGCVM